MGLGNYIMYVGVSGLSAESRYTEEERPGMLDSSLLPIENGEFGRNKCVWPLLIRKYS